MNPRKITRKPINRTETTTLANGRLERRSMDLKLGYLTSLTIIIDRKIMMTERMMGQRPDSRLIFSSHPSKNSVNDETSPAAAGMGNPMNSLPLLTPMADRQLNRDKRNAPQIK